METPITICNGDDLNDLYRLQRMCIDNKLFSTHIRSLNYTIPIHMFKGFTIYGRRKKRTNYCNSMIQNYKTYDIDIDFEIYKDRNKKVWRFKCVEKTKQS